MDKSKPSYYGILPAHVRYDNDLPPMARIMYAEITALSNKDGYCSAGNDYFAKLYDVSTVTVSRWVSKLGKQGHILIDADPVTGHDRKLYPLNKNVIPHNKNVKAPIQKDQGPLNKNVKHNSTSIILQDNSNSKSENLQKDLFVKVDGLKDKIGPNHYQLLNATCTSNEETYQKLKGMFHDGRFSSLMDFLEYKKESGKSYKKTAKSSLTALVNKVADYTPKEVEVGLANTLAAGYAGFIIKAFNENQKKPQATRINFSAARRKADVV
jgi:hypothetical protein